MTVHERETTPETILVVQLLHCTDSVSHNRVCIVFITSQRTGTESLTNDMVQLVFSVVHYLRLVNLPVYLEIGIAIMS